MKYYNSPNDPRVWGKYYWEQFFNRAAKYPKSNPSPQQRILFKNYYKSYLGRLPCLKCNPSFSKYWRELPIDNYLDDRRNLLMWLYLLKDKVNKKLTDQGIFKQSPPFGEVLRKYY